jgi:hypothetical protein
MLFCLLTEFKELGSGLFPYTFLLYTPVCVLQILEWSIVNLQYRYTFHLVVRSPSTRRITLQWLYTSGHVSLRGGRNLSDARVLNILPNSIRSSPSNVTVLIIELVQTSRLGVGPPSRLEKRPTARAPNRPFSGRLDLPGNVRNEGNTIQVAITYLDRSNELKWLQTQHEGYRNIDSQPVLRLGVACQLQNGPSAHKGPRSRRSTEEISAKPPSRSRNQQSHQGIPRFPVRSASRHFCLPLSLQEAPLQP